MHFGALIKVIRKRKHLTQAKLAEGICSRRYVVAVESGNVNPSSHYLEQFSLKLGVDLFSIVKYAHYSDPFYVKESNDLMLKYKENMAYEKLYRLINKLKKDENYPFKEQEALILWLEALCVYNLKNNGKKTLQLFHKVLNIDSIEESLDYIKNKKVHTQLELEMLNSYSAILISENYEKLGRDILEFIADYLEEDLSLIDKNILIKVYYNLAKNYNTCEDYIHSQYFTDKGIDLCIAEKTINYLGHLYYQKGVNLFYLNQHYKSKKFFQWAYDLFLMQDHQDLATIVAEKVKKKYANEIIIYR